MQEMEKLPYVTHLQSSAALTLTTLAQQVPSLLTSFSAPGNCYICVDVVLDIQTTAGAVAELWNQPPGQTLSSNGSSQQILLLPAAGIRATIGQVWTFLTPAPGTWHLSVQARSLAAADGTVQNLHSNMRVMVL